MAYYYVCTRDDYEPFRLKFPQGRDDPVILLRVGCKTDAALKLVAHFDRGMPANVIVRRWHGPLPDPKAVF